MSRITDLHNQILDFLLDWSEKEKQKSKYYTFYLRNAKDPKFSEGYWFPGDEEKICVTFWKGGDVISNTPNIFFEIDINNGLRSVFAANDSLSKLQFLSNIVQAIDIPTGNGLYKSKANLHDGVINCYEKVFARNILDIWSSLTHYLVVEKGAIDEYLEGHKNDIYFEEYVQPIAFIDKIEFEESLAAVHSQRKRLEKSRGMAKGIQPEAGLPIALKGISIENFQGMSRTDVYDLPTDTQWIFVTGENGYGKTSLLQAIALGLNDNPELEKYINQLTKINCEITYKGEEVNSIKLSNHNISSYRSKGYYGKFVLGYGPLRLNIQAESSENQEMRSRVNVLGLFDSTTLMKNINYELFSSNSVNDSDFRNLRNAIIEVTNGRIADIKVERKEVLYTEKLSNGDMLPPLPLEKLASGFRSIINLVGDIVVRFSSVQPERDYKDLMGIVLVDELENHLHPLLQRELPLTLSKVFPKIQFIASTHSPIPLLGAPKNTVILTVNRNKKEGSTIERLDDKIDFPSLLPNSILTSPVFGFEKIIPESHDGSSFVRTEQTYGEIKENDKRRGEIDTFLTDNRKNDLLLLLKK